MAKKGKEAQNQGPRVIQNRRARFDYELLDTYEAGLVLVGSEVKSIWLGRANLTDSFCKFVGTELWIVSLDIEPYEHASHFQPDRRRDRKLLLHRKELETIERKSMEKGLTIVPTKLFFSHGKAKVQIALARGKRSYDKRDQIAKDDTRREMERLRSERY